MKSLRSPAHLRLMALLAAARDWAGLTQQQLADRLGKPQSFVAKYEGGERRLDLVEFMTIARALGFDWTVAVQELEVEYGPLTEPLKLVGPGEPVGLPALPGPGRPGPLADAPHPDTVDSQTTGSREFSQESARGPGSAEDPDGLHNAPGPDDSKK